MEVRDAQVHDVEPIARLHAASWRRSYRGMYSDHFLDHEVDAERRAVWTERFADPAPNQHTIVAIDDAGELAGFAHTYFDDDPTYGALLDNLHVVHDVKGRGIGTLLMARTAAAVLERAHPTGLYLWVLAMNTPAQAFYAARGGTCAERAPFAAPGGGTVESLRIVWPDPAVLLDFVT